MKNDSSRAVRIDRDIHFTIKKVSVEKDTDLKKEICRRLKKSLEDDGIQITSPPALNFDTCFK